jgi:hypothetical protein
MKASFLFILFSFLFISASAQSEPSKPTLEDYVGKYVFPEGSVVPDVTVTLSGNALSMSSVQGSSALVQQGIDTFQITEFSGIAIFKIGDDKKVNGVHIEAMGYVLDGRKESSGLWRFTYLRPHKELLLARR